MAAKPLFVPVQPDPLNIAIRSDSRVTHAVLLDGLITQNIRAYSRDGNWQVVVQSLRDRADNDRALAKLIEQVMKERAQ